jgi:hypothetical protein
MLWVLQSNNTDNIDTTKLNVQPLLDLDHYVISYDTTDNLYDINELIDDNLV